MEGYVISPFLIYLLSIIDSVVSISVIMIFILLIASLISLMDENTDKYFLKLIAGAIVSLLLAIFVPSKDTIIGMIVAKNITYERLNDGTEIAKKSIDYIFEKIEEIEKIK